MIKMIFALIFLFVFGCSHTKTSKGEVVLTSDHSLIDFKSVFDALGKIKFLSFDEAINRFGPDIKRPYEAMSSCPNAKFKVKDGGTIMLIFFKYKDPNFYMTSAIYTNENGDRQILYSIEPEI